MKIDISVLREQLGIEVENDDNGYLSAGDVIRSHLKGPEDNYTVTEADLASLESIQSLLNEHSFPRTRVSVFSNDAKEYYVAALTGDTEGFLRVNQINEGADEVVITDNLPYFHPHQSPGVSTPLGHEVFVEEKTTDEADAADADRIVNVRELPYSDIDRLVGRSERVYEITIAEPSSEFTNAVDEMRLMLSASESKMMLKQAIIDGVDGSTLSEMVDAHRALLQRIAEE